MVEMVATQDSGVRKKRVLRNVYWDVVDMIIGDIRSHKLKPGDRIPTEIDLMNDTGLSRSSVREAIKVLSALGLVNIARGDGTFVSDAQDVMGVESIAYTLLMDSVPMHQVIEFRACIECMLYRVVAQKITDEEIAMLEDNIARSYVCFESGEKNLLKELDLQFHMMIVSFSHNVFIEKQLRGVYEFFTEEFISKNTYTVEEFNSSMASHKDAVKYFKTKDIKHLESCAKRISIWEIG